MAKPKSDSKSTTVTRIKATDLPAEKDKRGDKKTAVKQPKKTSEKKVVIDSETGEAKQNFFKRFIGYFVGAWHELKQVRWPNRRATWSMTAALLIFTALFAGLILVADTVWQYLFKLILE